MAQEHKCKGSEATPYTVENRDGKWYIYSGDERGKLPINFCPFCGVRVQEATSEADQKGE